MQIKRVLATVAIVVFCAACSDKRGDDTQAVTDTIKPATGTTATETGAGGPIASKAGDTRPRVATKATTTSATTTSQSTATH
jgi:hypothetical protein